MEQTGNVSIFKQLDFSVIEESTPERFLGMQGQSVTVVTLKRYVSKHP